MPRRTILVAGPFIDGSKELDGSASMQAWRRESTREGLDARRVSALVDVLAPRVDLPKIHSRLARDAFFQLATDAMDAEAIETPIVVHLPVGIEPLEAVRAGARVIEHTICFLGDAVYEDDPQAARAATESAVERLRRSEGDELLRAVVERGRYEHIGGNAVSE